MKKILLMLSGIGLLACQSHEPQADPAKGSMTILEAQQRIAEQRDLESIPKKVWQEILKPEQYKILWDKGTERAFTGELLHVKQSGTFVTAGCRLPVFHTLNKFESGTGWPSFWEVFDKDNVVLKTDTSWGMKRTEVLSKCGEHLGHVFEDGPEPTGLRYCINSLALEFVPDKNDGVQSK